MSKRFLPPAVLGVIGGGQLGMMTVREAQRMGYRNVVWDPDPDCPASKLADSVFTAPFDDKATAQQFVQKSDVITYEFENIDPDIVQWIEERKEVYPGSRILRIARHRRTEKKELRQRGYPTVDFQTAKGNVELSASINSVGLPIVVKTATSGYDGKGQSFLKDKADVEAFLAQKEGRPIEYIVEKFIDLQCEVSVVAARGKDGTIITLPAAENIHRENILHTSFVPARIPVEVRSQAEQLARSIIAEFNIIGVLCVEMFVTNDNKVLVNELAPRPHNSGHFSLDACDVSQFEELVRAVCGLSIPEPRLLSSCAMVNLLGKHLAKLNIEKLLRLKGIKLHLYGKKRVEPKRKMGHVTIVCESPDEVDRAVNKVYALIGEEESASLEQSMIQKSYSPISQEPRSGG